MRKLREWGRRLRRLERKRPQHWFYLLPPSTAHKYVHTSISTMCAQYNQLLTQTHAQTHLHCTHKKHLSCCSHQWNALKHPVLPLSRLKSTALLYKQVVAINAMEFPAHCFKSTKVLKTVLEPRKCTNQWSKGPSCCRATSQSAHYCLWTREM